MENGKINKHKTLAAMVRAFFNAFSAGIIDCHVSDAHEKRQPQVVKKIMLERYEQIAGAFHDVLFYPIAHINYDDEQQITKCIQDNYKEGMSMADLVRIACKTNEQHEAMIAEYKRNFEWLLTGRMPTAAEHEKEYTRGGSDMDTGKAISLTVSVVIRSYAKGIELSGKEDAKFHQPSVLRLTLDAMNVLLSDVEADDKSFDDSDGLAGLFMKACKKKEYFQLMTETMDKEYMNL